jgi:hypothetical protein
MFLGILVRHNTKVDNRKKSLTNELPAPERILHVLHDADPKTFYFDPNGTSGHHGQNYLIQVMKYFELNKKVLYCIYPLSGQAPNGIYVHFDNIITKPTRYFRFGEGKFNSNNNKSKEIYYGSKHVGKNTWKNSKGNIRVGHLHRPKPPDARTLVFEKDKLDLVLTKMATTATKNWANIDVIQVKIGEHSEGLKQTWDERYTDGARIWTGKLQEEITVGGFSYKVDSMIISNSRSKSKKGCGHEIAGVTCNGKRYMYSGYLQDPTNIQSACPLMPFDWFSQEGDFCINTPDCKLSGLGNWTWGKANKSMCFDMHQSERTYLYIKEQPLNVNRVCGKLKRNVAN